MHVRELCTAAGALAAALWTGSALAAEPADPCTGDDIVAGVAAYRNGRYDVAIQAFEQAAESTSNPDVLFRLAEAYRQQHALTPSNELRDAAIARYKRYLRIKGVKETHRAVAEQEVNKLSDQQLLPADESAAPPAKTPRLAVLSPTPGATATIDDDAADKAPRFESAAPGRHVVVLRAAGGKPRRCEVSIDPNELVVVFAKLDPLPGYLRLAGDEGAKVRLNGTTVGAFPFDKALEVEPGTHTITVLKNGFERYETTVSVRRGEAKPLLVELEGTDQRTAAWSLLSVGGAGIGAGIGFGVASIVNHREARDLIRENGDTTLDDDEQQVVDEAESRRDDFRIVSGITMGVGLTAFAVGGVLFVADAPEGAGDDEGDERASLGHWLRAARIEASPDGVSGALRVFF